MEVNKFITNEKDNMLTQMNTDRVMTDDELKVLFGEGKDPTHVDYECLIDSKANSQDVYTKKYLQRVMEAYYGSSPEIASDWYDKEIDRREFEVIRKENEVIRCNQEDQRQRSISTMETNINDKIVDVENRMVSVETDLNERIGAIESEFDELVDGTGFASIRHVEERLALKSNKSETYTIAEMDVKLENIIAGNTGTNVSFGVTVVKSDWILDSVSGKYYIDIFHELETKRFIATLVDNDTNINMNPNYQIIDDNRARFFSDISLNATITIINGNTVTEMAYAKIDDVNITENRTWSSKKIKTEIDNKTVDLSPLELQISENKKQIDINQSQIQLNTRDILALQNEVGLNKSKLIIATNKIIKTINGVK